MGDDFPGVQQIAALRGNTVLRNNDFVSLRLSYTVSRLYVLFHRQGIEYGT